MDFYDFQYFVMYNFLMVQIEKKIRFPLLTLGIFSFGENFVSNPVELNLTLDSYFRLCQMDL